MDALDLFTKVAKHIRGNLRFAYARCHWICAIPEILRSIRLYFFFSVFLFNSVHLTNFKVSRSCEARYLHAYYTNIKILKMACLPLFSNWLGRLQMRVSRSQRQCASAIKCFQHVCRMMSFSFGKILPTKGVENRIDAEVFYNCSCLESWMLGMERNSYGLRCEIFK